MDISKINQSQQSNIFDKITQNTTKTKPYPNDSIELSRDKEKTDKKNTRKIVKTIAGITAAISSAAIFICCVGRNPIKASKVLKGTSEVIGEAYKKALPRIDDILNTSGTFKTNIDDITKHFTNKSGSKMIDGIDEMHKLFKSENVEIPDNIQGSLSTLKKELTRINDEIKQKLLKGEDINMNQLSDSFTKDNQEHLDSVQKFLMKHSWDFDNSSKTLRNGIGEVEMMFSPDYTRSKDIFQDGISKCSEDILPEDGIYYHGTQKAKEIYKNGFSPYISKQIATSPRELGAAVYVTPDKRVAASFASLGGDIIPVKLSSDKIAFVSESAYKKINKTAQSYLAERAPELVGKNTEEGNALIECFMQRIFKDAGYDAAYIPKGVKAGGGWIDIRPDINKVIGANQSQLIVFKPETLEIQSRPVLQRIKDLGDKMKSIKAQIDWAKAHPLGF